MSGRRWWEVAAIVALVGGLTGLGFLVALDANRGAAVDRARTAARAGRFEEARRLLVDLPAAWRAEPEAADLLGTAEHAAGHFEAALAAWERVPAGSARSTSLALARARTLVGDLGRLLDAEILLEATLPQAGPLRLEVAHTLSQLYFLEGRPDAMRRVILETGRDWRDPASELRDLWLIDDATVMVDEVGQALKAAEAKAPGESRVGLGRVGLDLLAGRFDEANRRLDELTKRRPDDPALGLARLRVARGLDDPAEGRLALARLPAGSVREADLLDLRAWLAARRGDAEDERRTLERRALVEPADPRTLERLAVLAWEAGRRDDADTLRRRKAELDAAKDRYRRLLTDRPPTGAFADLASLAETLGRPFEAAGWWRLVRAGRPDDLAALAALDRLKDRLGPPRLPRGGTLADQMAALFPSTKPATGVDRVKAGPPSAVAFSDDAEKVGLRFTLEVGRTPARQVPETTAGGVAVLDYDGDGWLDVYAVQAGAFPPGPSHPHGGDRLFHNRGDGTFEDRTEAAGIAAMPRGFGHGVAVGDIDNDGDPDLLVTRWRGYALYRNRGDGTFEDATEAVGLAGARGWPTSAAFADLDNDGDLDLYVAHYVLWDAENPKLCPRVPPAGEGPDPARPYGYCMPQGLIAESDHLFRNDGGKFIDVTAEAGISDRDGRGLGVVAADLDDDGRVDLVVANDTTANYLFHNLGGLRFEEVGALAGVASNADGAFQAGMGTAVGDLDGDGRIDLAVTNFYGESTTFYRNLGGGTFADQTNASGLGTASRYLLGFGVTFLDANNDGWLDLATANGHVNDDRPKFPYAMPAQLLLGTGGGRLVVPPSALSSPWSTPRIGRGLARADLDNDGRLDLLLVAQEGPLAYFHNQTPTGRSTTFRLEGTRSNRDAVGARLTLTAGGRKQVATRAGGGSYQTAADPRLHFGLGPLDRIEAIEVRWPSGQVDQHHDLASGAGYLLREGDTQAHPLPGFPGPR